MAKIYPLEMHLEVLWRQQMEELKIAFMAEYLSFFILALDTSTKLGGNSPRGLRTMQRAYALLTEANNKFKQEF
jgi:hypothetical protein